MKTLLSTSLFALIFACAQGPPRVDCRTEVDLGALGLLASRDRIWVVDDLHRGYGDLIQYAAGCLARTRSPIAFVADEGREFLGMARLAKRSREGSERDWRLFDDFNRNWDRRRPAATCRPSDYESLKQSHRILDIRNRRILVSDGDLTDQDIEFASAWLERCIPTRDPLAWISSEDGLIGVYHHRRFDRFE